MPARAEGGLLSLMGADAGKSKRGNHHWAAKCKIDASKEFEEKGIPFVEDPDEVNLRELKDLGSFFGMQMQGDEVRSRCKGVMAFAASAISSTTSRAQGTLSPEAASLKAKGLLWKSVYARQAKPDAASEPAPTGTPVEQVPPPAEVAVVPELPISAWPASEPSTPSARRPASSRKSTERLQSKRATSLGSALLPVAVAGQSMDSSELPAQLMLARRAQERIHRPVSPRELVEARNPAPLSIADFPPIFRRAAERPQETHYAYFTRHIPEERPELRKALQRRAESTRRIVNGRELLLSAIESEPLRVRSATEPATSSSAGPSVGRSSVPPDAASSLPLVPLLSADGGRALRHKDSLGGALSPRSGATATGAGANVTPRACSTTTSDAGIGAAGRRRRAAF